MGTTTESVRIDARTREKKQKEDIDWRGKNFYQQVYGNLYENTPGGTNLVLTTAGVWYPWVSSTEGESSGIDYAVVSAASDNITIGASGAGVYLITVSCSFSGSNNAEIHMSVFKGGVEQSTIQAHRKLGGADIGSMSCSGLLVLAASDIIDLRFSSDTNSTTVTLEHVQLTIVRISA